jgi:hypothetical protein
MSEELRSIIVGTAGLSSLAAVALLLTLARTVPPSGNSAARQVRWIAALGIFLHLGHFIEEWLTGFQVRFPSLLGFAPWSSAFFVSFNLFWVTIWILCLVFFELRTRMTLFPIWFLALGSTANGLVHPLLSVTVAGYFPGLWSSPLVGICGVFLIRALASFTRGKTDWR